MLLGAVVGWGILSPLAKYKGWAPGPVGDWTTGSRGWLVWTSLAMYVSDIIPSPPCPNSHPSLVTALLCILRQAGKMHFESHARNSAHLMPRMNSLEVGC